MVSAEVWSQPGPIGSFGMRVTPQKLSHLEVQGQDEQLWLLAANTAAKGGGTQASQRVSFLIFNFTKEK